MTPSQAPPPAWREQRAQGTAPCCRTAPEFSAEQLPAKEDAVSRDQNPYHCPFWVPQAQSPEPCSPLPGTSHFCNVTEDRRVRSSQCPEVPPASRTGALQGRGSPTVRASAPVYFLCRYRHPATPSTKGVPSFSFMKAEYLPFYFPVS